MATALSTAGITANAVSDEERRWMVVGVCLNKVLTPALRDVLANEIPKWHHVLLQPPCEIDKQTFGKHEKKLPRSTLNLNYNSINNNNAHKSPRAYDYAVKDPLSLAKLFMKPFMANFTGFDQTMDVSAILSVMCEAEPFIASGADVFAKNVKSDIRNEWAHCNFTHWTEPKFKVALQFMVSLIQKSKLTPVKEKELLDELHSWECKGKLFDQKYAQRNETRFRGILYDFSKVEMRVNGHMKGKLSLYYLKELVFTPRRYLTSFLRYFDLLDM